MRIATIARWVSHQRALHVKVRPPYLSARDQIFAVVSSARHRNVRGSLERRALPASFRHRLDSETLDDIVYGLRRKAQITL